MGSSKESDALELSREPAVMDRELSAPEPPEAVDRTVFLTALTVLGDVVSGGHDVRPIPGMGPSTRVCDRDRHTPRTNIHLARPLRIRGGAGHGGTSSAQGRAGKPLVHFQSVLDPLQPPTPLGTSSRASSQLPLSSPNRFRGVVSAASQVLSGTILSVGNGFLTVQAGTGAIVVKIGDNTVILVNGQPRSLNDLKVAESVTLVGATVDPTGSSSGPVTPDPASRDKGPVPGVDPVLKDIPVKIPGP